MSHKSTGAAPLHGFLNIDKPAGWTSHDVVARVRRLIGERHVGHAGTLDPAATGVLPVAVGSATKVLEYLSESSKTYLAEITFGVETDSYDLDGQLTKISDASAVTREDVEPALEQFRGAIEQIPPMHSAIKIGGKKLYELARQGEIIERAPREVAINLLTLLDWSPPVATLLIDCSKGTYIRSLARDIGDKVGVGAHLSNLVRIRTGPFFICESWTISELEAIDMRTAWPDVAQHPDVPIAGWPVLILGDDEERLWSTGRAFASLDGADKPGRVYNPRGDWVGIAEYDQTRSLWRPEKVVVSAA
jgi:tRNA pseudouridine55 synthase